MIELIGALFDSLFLWGVALGLVVAALITWIVSFIIWGEFNSGLFIGVAVPCLIGGIYWQHLIEKGE